MAEPCVFLEEAYPTQASSLSSKMSDGHFARHGRFGSLQLALFDGLLDAWECQVAQFIKKEFDKRHWLN